MKFKNDDLLNDADLKIIDILYKNSLTHFVEIAKQTRTSDATVHIRVRILVAEKIIKKFTLSLNNDLMGYNLGALVVHMI
jgi:Lrp/AsnC family transcriptional regulator, regulator for asnA, asnC and gidA